MKAFSTTIQAFFRMIFLFRKPTYTELDYISVIIDQKELLLFTWSLPKKYTIHIPALKRKIRVKAGGYILKLPSGQRKIKIKINSAWRSTAHILQLDATKMGKSELDSLTKSLKPMDMPAIKIDLPGVTHQNPGAIAQVRLKMTSPRLHPGNFFINYANLTYSENNNS